MSIIKDCALKPVGELPFVLEKGACQARLDDKVMLCFSGHESSDDNRDGYSDRPILVSPFLKIEIFSHRPKYSTSLSFSSIHDNRDEDGPGTKTCWQFDEVNGEYKYSNEIPDTEFGHKHNPMAMYDLNPLGQISKLYLLHEICCKTL